MVPRLHAAALTGIASSVMANVSSAVVTADREKGFFDKLVPKFMDYLGA